MKKILKLFHNFLLTWKPIPLCWWFEKHNWKIPKYLIGKSAPTVTTQNCTDILDTTATGNGNVTDVGAGYSAVTSRGICYMVGTSGDPTTANSKVQEDGSFAAGAFTRSLTGLTGSTGYRVRAYAINATGTGYGATVQLTTLKTYVSGGVVASIIII